MQVAYVRLETSYFSPVNLGKKTLIHTVSFSQKSVGVLMPFSNKHLTEQLLGIRIYVSLMSKKRKKEVFMDDCRSMYEYVSHARRKWYRILLNVW